jgi:hypothetical protein
MAITVKLRRLSQMLKTIGGNFEHLIEKYRTKTFLKLETTEEAPRAQPAGMVIMSRAKNLA